MLPGVGRGAARAGWAGAFSADLIARRSGLLRKDEPLAARQLHDAHCTGHVEPARRQECIHQAPTIERERRHELFAADPELASVSVVRVRVGIR